MKKTILATLIGFFLILPYSIADQSFIAYPGSTASPMVQVPMLQARYFNLKESAPIREGMPVLVYGQVPQTGTETAPQSPHTGLMIDEYGTLVNYQNEPVVIGTTGRSFARGYDWTHLYPWTRIGSYFTTNLRGFKAGLATAFRLNKWGGRTYGVYSYEGYGPAIRVIKQWYRPRTETTGYIVPGVTNMVTQTPSYVRPGIPSYITPESTETVRATTSSISQRPGATIKIVPKPVEQPAEEQPTTETGTTEIGTTGTDTTKTGTTQGANTSADDLGNLNTQ